ncbi:glycosyltransferase [Oerskovia turbata]
MPEPARTVYSSADFSVLLPVYHRDSPSFLRRAFDSVTVEQTLAPTEVVIVRDGPVGPELDALLDELATTSSVPVEVVELPQNVGLARALEHGLRRCSHEIVARMDADDISRPERFAVQVPLAAAGLDIVGSAIQEFDDESRIRDVGAVVRTPPTSAQDIRAGARFHSPFNHPSVVYRRSAVAAAGGYQDLPLMEDYWLFVRMLHAGAVAGNVPDPLVLYRVGAGAYARRGGWRLLRSEIRLQWRMWRSGFSTAPQLVRNVVVRGGYRLVPEAVRRRMYRWWVAVR